MLSVVGVAGGWQGEEGQNEGSQWPDQGVRGSEGPHGGSKVQIWVGTAGKMVEWGTGVGYQTGDGTPNRNGVVVRVGGSRKGMEFQTGVGSQSLVGPPDTDGVLEVDGGVPDR